MPSKPKKEMKKSKAIRSGKSLQPVKALTKSGGAVPYLTVTLKDVH